MGVTVDNKLKFEIQIKKMWQSEAANRLFEKDENYLSSSHTTNRPLCDVQIHNFQQVTLDMVKKFAVKTLTKSCDLDPVPASVLKTCFSIILPTLTLVINMSLKNGVMPYALKVAVLKPLLKKQDADFEQLQNFPPNLKSNICVQANREGCCFEIKRPYT